jgi:hypothetical protein
MELGYILCADIMGFSKLVDHLDCSILEDRINAWISLVIRTATECHLSKVRLLSDTVYVAVNNDKLELKKLIKFSKILLAEGIKIAIPMRGAISFGQYNWGELIYGKAVLAAHRLEKIQKWIGVVIDLEILIENEEAFDLGLKQYFVPILNDESKCILHCNLEYSFFS